ncbi:MAG: hypothetical protein VST68_00595 [Nitrospirota bacterium]|nr:hypothetical protein [Nitrospirota bacterium]
MPGHSRNLIASRNVRGCSKISAISPTQTQGRQDALFHGQGRSCFGGRNVQAYVSTTKERERRWRTFSTPSLNTFPEVINHKVTFSDTILVIDCWVKRLA